MVRVDRKCEAYVSRTLLCPAEKAAVAIPLRCGEGVSLQMKLRRVAFIY